MSTPIRVGDEHMRRSWTMLMGTWLDEPRRRSYLQGSNLGHMCRLVALDPGTVGIDSTPQIGKFVFHLTHWQVQLQKTWMESTMEMRVCSRCACTTQKSHAHMTTKVAGTQHAASPKNWSFLLPECRQVRLRSGGFEVRLALSGHCLRAA